MDLYFKSDRAERFREELDSDCAWLGVVHLPSPQCAHRTLMLATMFGTDLFICLSYLRIERHFLAATTAFVVRHLKRTTRFEVEINTQTPLSPEEVVSSFCLRGQAPQSSKVFLRNPGEKRSRFVLAYEQWMMMFKNLPTCFRN